MDYLSLCAIVKNENDYLPEWIEYHKLIGFERLYLYDNGSRIPLSKTLAKDIADGSLIVTHFPGHGVQTDAYAACVKNYGTKTIWLAFIDVDEFICLKDKNDFRQFLRDYEKFGGLGINWQVFGYGNHDVRPSGLQIENFTLKGEVTSWNAHIKTVARTDRVALANNPHYCIFKDGSFCVNEKGQKISGPFSEPISVDRIQLNHYYTRSRAEFKEKMIRGRGDGGERTNEVWAFVETNLSKVKDESILRFVPALRANLTARG